MSDSYASNVSPGSENRPDRASDRAAVAEALRRARRVLLTTHARMDGDALGSVLGLHLVAAAAGKDSQMAVEEAIPRRYAFLFDRARPAGWERFAELADEADLIVVVDTCAFAQLEPIAEALRARREKVAVIDHHATADAVGATVWRDTSAAAAGVMVMELLEELSWPVDTASAEALLVAICADTGWFRYANTDGRALRAAATLLDVGVRADVLYARLHESDRPQRVRLLAAALSSLELHAADRLAVMSLSQDDFARCGAAGDETEDFVNEPLRIAGVEISAILIAQPDGVTRVSLRSRGGVDVAALAGRFGGGGHARAAGFRCRDDLPAAKQRLVAACTEALASAGG